MSTVIKVYSNRLDFLSESEINYYFELPKFGNSERKIYFQYDSKEWSVIQNISNYKSKLHFCLLLGYFKAKTILFNLNDSPPNPKDIKYISDQFSRDFDHQIKTSEPIRNRHKELVLNVTGWLQYKPSLHRKVLTDLACGLATIHIKPIFIYTEVVRHLIDRQIEMPSYAEFQLIIGQGMRSQEKKLEKHLEKIPENHKQQLNRLLENKTQEGALNLKDIIDVPNGLTNTEITMEIDRFNSIEDLLHHALKIIEQTKISEESVKYYSGLVHYYGRAKLVRMKNSLVPLYILCFITQRTKKSNDALAETFHGLISKYKQKALTLSTEYQSENKLLFDKNETSLAEVITLFINPENKKLTAEKLSESAFEILNEDKIQKLVNYMQHHREEKRKLQWEFIAKSESKYKNNLRIIFKHLTINYGECNALEVATKALKIQLEAKNYIDDCLVDTALLPMGGISEDMHKIITEMSSENKPMVNIYKYEFYLYTLIDEALIAGDISILHSYQYTAYEDDIFKGDILNDERLKSLNLTMLDTPIEEHLKFLEDELETQIKQTNENINVGNNTAINIKDSDNRKWTLPYQKDAIEINHSIFDDLPVMDIADVFEFAQRETNFMSEFSHILPKDTRKELDLNLLKATLIAKATNHGIYRMSRLSDYTLEELRNCNRSYISLESVRNACNTLSNAISELPIFKEYNINNVLHAGIDGQKHATKYRCFKSRHSPKYFYLGKGYSSATLLINHIPANAMIFGAHEHESRFIFDLIYNNETEIQPEIISTDSAGSNCVNFALLDIFKYQFAPCFKRINNKEGMLSGFRTPAYYKKRNYLVRPTSAIKIDKIVDQWPEVKKIIAALALKKSNQTTLIRKLTSSSIKNEVKEALWEYNKIIRSEYIFRYIDNQQLREGVRKALNRNEAYHQLKRTITTVNSDKLIGKDDDNLFINDECARLLSEIVIYYNACLLSEIIEDKKRQGKLSELEYIHKVSLVAWQHINLHGIYKFKSRVKIIHLSHMIKGLKAIIITQ